MSNFSVGGNAGAPLTGGAQPQGVDQVTLQVLQQNGIDPSTLSPQQLAQAQQQVHAMIAQQQGAQGGAMGSAAKMMQGLSGDGGNTLGIAAYAGMNALSIGKAGTTMAADQLIKSPGAVLNQAKANLPLADALQQQSAIPRYLGKIPYVGRFLGPDPINATIGGLSKEALNNVPKAQVTQIVLAGGDVAKNLKAAGVPADAIKQIGASIDQVAKGAAETAAKTATTTAAKGAATQTAATAAKGAATSVQAKLLVADVKAALPKNAIRAGFKLTPGEISKALKAGTTSDELYKMGLSKAAVKSVMTAAGSSEVTFAESGARAVAKKGATQAVEQTAKAGGLGGLLEKIPGKNILGKLVSGAKGNFVVAGLFSIGSNAVSLATGKMNVKQFLGLSALDTAAYGGIGLGAAAVGGVFGGPIGFAVGLGVGMAGGWLYDKFIRKPVKQMLGGPTGSGAAAGAPAGYNPQAQAPQAAQAAQAAPAQAGAVVDPYASQATVPQAGAPAGAPMGAASAGAAPANFDDALKQLGG